MPPPEVNITHEGALAVGSNTTLICTVNYYNISDDIQMNFTWLSSDIVLSNGQEMATVSESSGSQQSFINELTLSLLSAYDDNILITCSAIAYLATPNSLIKTSSSESIAVRLNIEGNIT